MSSLHHQNHLSDDLYILLDFSCGRFYTHHSSYLKDYYDFLTLCQKTVKVWVNTSADQKVLDLFGDNVSPILRSNFYSHTRKDRLILSLIDSMVNWIYKLRIPRMFRNWLSSYYLRLAVKELKVHLKTAPRVNIVIPTLDGLGLHFVLKALKLYPSKVECISLRITGAERRGIFGFVNSSEIFKSICEKFPDKLHLGFEVKRYETKLVEDGISSKNIFWAPMPHIFRRPKTYLDKELMHESITLGFLGSARPNKGFDDIPKILDSLKANNIIFTALIQLPKFEWPEFRQTYNKLQKNHLNVVKFINSSISKENLDRRISSVDLIVLPYRFHNYQLAGSGILFLAADYKVPVASTNNLAFCWDIERFKIGFTFEDESDFSFKLKYFSKSSLQSNFEHYNDSRNVANLKFLRIA